MDEIKTPLGKTQGVKIIFEIDPAGFGRKPPLIVRDQSVGSIINVFG